MRAARTSSSILLVAATLAAALGWIVFARPDQAPTTTDVSEGVHEGRGEQGPLLRGNDRTRPGARAPMPESGTGEPGAGTAGSEAAEDRPTPLARPASLDILVVGWRGQPVVGASVATESTPEDGAASLDPRSVHTDEQGRARVTGLRWPHAQVQVVASAHDDVGWSIDDLQAGEERRLRVELRPVSTLRGRVVRASDRAPLAGARVVLREAPLGSLYRSEEWGESFVTRDPVACDGSGAFHFEDLRIGSGYALWVEAPGYDRAEREVVLLRPDSAPEVEIALQPAGSVTARVVDTLDQPVEGFRVVLVPEDAFVRMEAAGRGRSRLVDLDAVEAGTGDAGGAADELEGALASLGDGFSFGSWFGSHSPSVYAATTDARGVAVIQGIALGRTFRVDPWPTRDSFDDGDWQPSWADPPLRVEARAAAPSVELTLRVAASATLRVRCVDGSGQPLAGTPRVTWKGVRDLQFGMTESPHEWRCTGLAPGEGELVCHARGYAPGRITLRLAPGSDTLVEVPLSPAPLLRGRVVDEAGRPFAHGTVWLLGTFEEVVELVEDGRFDLPVHAPGGLRLRVSSPDADQPLEMSVAAPAEALGGTPGEPLTITLPRGLRGRVLATLPAAPHEPDAEEDAQEDAEEEARDDEGRPALRLDAIASDGSPSPLDDSRWVDVYDLTDGRWTWDVPPGAYWLTCLVRGCAVMRRRLDVEAGAVLDLGLLDVPRPPPVEALVLLADGRPAAFARARLEGYDLVTADAWGRIRLAHGPTGPLRAVVGGRGYLALEQQVTPAPAGEPLRLRARRGSVLEGSVVADGARDAFALRIEALGEWARTPRVPTLIDSAWKFHAQLLPGRYRVSLVRAGAVRASTDVSLTEEQTTSTVLSAPRER